MKFDDVASPGASSRHRRSRTSQWGGATIYRDKNVTDKVYDTAVEKLGEKGVVEAIAAMGYYDLVSMTLITARAVPRDTGAPILQPLPK